MAKQHFIPAEFHGNSLDIIDHNSQKWLTAEQIGLCLGYSSANAGTGITNLYGRHKDEFSESDTCAIKLMAQGQMREKRIFSDTGCIKLGFFANTPLAREFRAWAARALSRRPDEIQLSALVKLADILKRSPDTARLLRYLNHGLERWEIGLLLDCSRNAVDHRVKRLRKIGLLPPPSLTHQRPAKATLPFSLASREVQP